MDISEIEFKQKGKNRKYLEDAVKKLSSNLLLSRGKRDTPSDHEPPLSPIKPENISVKYDKGEVVIETSERVDETNIPTMSRINGRGIYFQILEYKYCIQRQ